MPGMTACPCCGYDTIEFEVDEIEAAQAWHGGQSSMLYAVASTGALSLGTMRPKDCDGGVMSDREWFEYLVANLAREVRWARGAAQERINAGDEERDELEEQVDAFESMLAKCSAIVEETR